MSDSIHNPGDYTEAAITDVASVLTTLKSKLVTNGNWTLTSEVAGTNLRVKSPVKAGSGAFLDILIAKIDADTLDFTVADSNGTTIRQGRIDGAAAGVTFDYYWGDDYLVVISQRATPEVFQAYILDCSAVGGPESDTAVKVCAQAYRDTAGTTAAARIVAGSLYAIDTGVSTIESRVRSTGRSTGLANIGLNGLAARLLFFPAVCIVGVSSVYYHLGALPMCWMGDLNLAVGTVKSLPVDVGTLRAFIVLPLTAATNDGWRQLIRKPSAD